MNRKPLPFVCHSSLIIQHSSFLFPLRPLRFNPLSHDYGVFGFASGLPCVFFG